MRHLVTDSLHDIEDLVGLRACISDFAEFCVRLFAEFGYEILVGSRTEVEPESPRRNRREVLFNIKIVDEAKNVRQGDRIVILQLDGVLFALLVAKD